MIIDKQENKYVSIRTLDAAFTRMSNFRNRATTINTPVINIDRWGVLNLVLIFLKDFGNKPSLLNASGYLEADIMPALAVETKARTAAILNTILPQDPMKIAAPSEIGVRE